MRPRLVLPLATVSLCVFLAACRREEIRTYATPKEQAPVAAPAADLSKVPPTAADADAVMRNTAVTTASGPGLAWTAPAHWQTGDERPMRRATFLVTAEDGATAELAVTAFPGDVGGNLANVNRWLQQLGSQPVSEANLRQLLQHIHVGDLHIDVAELTSPGFPPAKRVLGAIVPHQGSTWFFKMDGPDALVTREKTAFYAFLQTLRPQS
jgi:hypothetical protein